MITPLGNIHDPESNQFLKLWQVEVAPAERILREHRHINFEIATVLEGEGVYHTASGIHPMKPGDVFVFSGNEPHCITKIMPGGLRLVNLHFNWQFWNRCCPAADGYPNMFFAHSGTFCNRIPGGRAETLRRLIEQIISEFAEGGQQLESTIGAYVSLMFTDLTRNQDYFQGDAEASSAVNKIIAGVRFIDEHYSEDITLEQIAEKSGITPNYYSKLFHQCFHVKLWDYITGKRIDMAKRLLRSGEDLTVLDIALSCGFHNTANFNRCFLKFTGITPSAYKARQELLH